MEEKIPYEILRHNQLMVENLYPTNSRTYPYLIVRILPQSILGELYANEIKAIA